MNIICRLLASLEISAESSPSSRAVVRDVFSTETAPGGGEDLVMTASVDHCYPGSLSVPMLRDSHPDLEVLLR